MDKLELIQSIINRFGYLSYLEIGYDDNYTFDRVIIEHKIGIDPTKGGTYRTTSNNFFAVNEEKFDLVFIDGLHVSEQVDLDIQNSLKVLNDNGTIILHDCNPRKEENQRPYKINLEWNGDVWKSFVKVRANPDLDSAVGDFDWGCGVIRKRPNSRQMFVDEVNLTWDNLVSHKKEWLRLMNPEELLGWIDYDTKISIVIPTYTNHKGLDECLASIEQYTCLDNVEVIVICNGSPVETKAVLRKYSFHESYWHNEPLGFSKAVNKGLDIAQGNYIVIMNDDTILFPQEKDAWLDAMKRPFIEDPLMAVTGRKQHVEEGFDFLIFFCVMLNRKTFNVIGMLDESFGKGGMEDVDYCVRAKLYGYKIKAVDFNIQHVPETTMYAVYGVEGYENHLNENRKKLSEKWRARLPVEKHKRKIVMLDNGIGDHYAFKSMMKEIKQPISVAACYPEVFDDIMISDDFKLIGFDEAMRFVSKEECSVYGKMREWGWKGSIVDAYRRMYCA